MRKISQSAENADSGMRIKGLVTLTKIVAITFWKSLRDNILAKNVPMGEEGIFAFPAGKNC